MKKTIIKIYKHILIVCVPYFVFTRVTGFGIPCVFRRTTGFMCPGCGATRMFISLAKLDFKSAFHYNSALFVLFPLWNAIALMCYLGKPRFVRKAVFLYTAFYMTIGILAVFGTVRNFC